MDSIFTGMILGFREGLEAFLIVVILLRFIQRSNRRELRRNVWLGSLTGVVISLAFGGILFYAAGAMNKLDQAAKLWESGSSLLALIFITTFIIWMIKNGSNMVGSVESQASAHLNAGGIFLLTALMVAREGVEILIFSFAGEYSILAIFLGIAAALALTVLIYYSLVKVNLKTIFTITMFYLILQAGFLLGYGIHEGLSAFKDLGMISESSPLLIKLFNLQNTVLDHKTGIIGLPLYVILGWYSRPEILQFVCQYLYTGSLLYYWYRTNQKADTDTLGEEVKAAA
jgi:high-affinity iron transporter